MTNGAPDPGPTLGAVRAAGVALEDAIRLAGQRQDRISADITAARAVLQEAAQAEVGLGTAAPEQLPERAAAAIEKSAAALKASCDLLGVSGLESKAGSLVDEWKECRATIDRCDKILVDLRKTGFGLVTAITVRLLHTPEAVKTLLGSFTTISGLVSTSATRASGTGRYMATPAPSSVSVVSATW